ncbi:MAG: M56 family metallopeptidase, partial [Pseudoxanthomonas sp.]
MANELLQALILSALAMTFALVLVLALRVPLRRCFGARVAYLAWWLVPLAMLAVLLPAPVREAATITKATMSAMGMAPMPTVQAGPVRAPLPDLRFWIFLLWFVGAG